MNDFVLQMKAMELAVGYTGYGFPCLSQAVCDEEQNQFPVRVATQTDGYGIAVLDMTLTNSGEIRLIEANGSNSGLTSIAFGHDYARAQHMLYAWQNRHKGDHQTVVLLPFKPGFMHLPEFFSRAYLFAKLVLQAEEETVLRNSDESCGAENNSVVCGPIPDVAHHITQRDGILFYRGRKVAFACNTNLLPELTRKDTVTITNGNYDVDTAIFHDGRLVRIIHDKATQQRVASGTGIIPLFFREGWNIDECAAIVREFNTNGMVAVGKMNAGSGGAGVEFFPPSTDNDVGTRLSALVSSAKSQYGDQVATTIFPIRFFEFVRSTSYKLSDGGHLWDIRFQCLISPGFVEVTPCLVRICPSPFNGASYSKSSVVSNLTGRKPSLEFVRSPMDQSVLETAGVSREILDRMVKVCAAWCESAWKFSK